MNWVADYDDVGADGVAGTHDPGEGDGIPTAGEPDFDQTDKDESDQIGLSSFEYFAPAGNFSIKDDESLWQRLAPGFFDVPPSIVNNKPIQGEDGDFIFASGFFPLPAGQTQKRLRSRASLATLPILRKERSSRIPGPANRPAFSKMKRKG